MRCPHTKMFPGRISYAGRGEEKGGGGEGKRKRGGQVGGSSLSQQGGALPRVTAIEKGNPDSHRACSLAARCPLSALRSLLPRDVPVHPRTCRMISMVSLMWLSVFSQYMISCAWGKKTQGTLTLPSFSPPNTQTSQSRPEMGPGGTTTPMSNSCCCSLPRFLPFVPILALPPHLLKHHKVL